MKEEINNYKQYILKNVAFWVKILRYVTFLIIIIATTKITFRYFSPFIFALLVSFFIKPLVTFLHSFKIKKGFSVALSILIVYGGLIYFFTLIVTRGLTELIEFAFQIPASWKMAQRTFCGQLDRRLTKHQLRVVFQPTDDAAPRK